jgi:hypothetical protein
MKMEKKMTTKKEWITGQQLIEQWQIKDFELIDYLKKGLKAHTEYGIPILDGEHIKIATMSYISTLNNEARHWSHGVLEDQARQLMKETDKTRIAHEGVYRDFSLASDAQVAQRMIDEARGYLFKVSEIRAFEKSHPELFDPKAKYSRKSQEHKERCRTEARILWEKDPSITIEDMANRDEINQAFDGKVYQPKTIREWIKDLCSNRNPGRRPKK